jgi:leucyl aminopeptidase
LEYYNPSSYVADEIITSRAEVRIRVGNTDAEGRMVMADVLCKMKEDVG